MERPQAYGTVSDHKQTGTEFPLIAANNQPGSRDISLRGLDNRLIPCAHVNLAPVIIGENSCVPDSHVHPLYDQQIGRLEVQYQGNIPSPAPKECPHTYLFNVPVARRPDKFVILDSKYKLTESIEKTPLHCNW